MPKSCSECRFFVDAWCYAFKADDWRNAYNKPPNGKRLDNCPLVPVPPHGRLGDLDKLVEKIDGIWDCNDMVFKPDDHCCNVPEDCKGCKWAQTKDCIQRMVENAPTIIEAEEGE
jgi:hypothetical protein